MSAATIRRLTAGRLGRGGGPASGAVSALRRWAMEVARRRGMKRAKVALARKLAGVLHRMWANGADFRWGKEEAAA